VSLSGTGFSRQIKEKMMSDGDNTASAEVFRLFKDESNEEPAEIETAEIIGMDFKLRMPVEVIRDNRAFCTHIGVDIDPETRIVTCRACGRQLDPVNVLLGMAERWRLVTYNVYKVREDTEKAVANLERLKKEEHNIKARIARMKKKIPQ